MRVLVILLILASIASAGKVDYTIQPLCTGSMRPTIECGDRLIVNTHTRGSNLTIGDIYCYRGDTRHWRIPWYTLICHRLEEKNGTHASFQRNSEILYKCYGKNGTMCGEPPVEHKFIALWVKEVIKDEKRPSVLVDATTEDS